MATRNPISKSVLDQYTDEIKFLQFGFDLINEHVIITDQDANILYANKAVENNTGYSVDEIIGKNPGDFWGGKMPKDYYEKMWHRIKDEKKPFVGEVHNIKKDGTEYWQEIHISPILDDKGEIRFFIGIEPNITDRKERERFRENFVAVVSHQLQNPLGVVRLLLEWMSKDSKLDNEQRSKIEEAYRQCNGLSNLISDLLVVSGIGKERAEKEFVDIANEVRDVIKTVKQYKPRTNFVFKAGEGEFLIQSYRALMRQVFLNIISNAADYSGKDNNEVTVSLEKNGDAYVFSCKDNGIGIPMEDQKNIFSRFFRASNAKQVKKIGTGLGLFIAKSIADNIGWEISFESQLGKGTTFFVKISIHK